MLQAESSCARDWEPANLPVEPRTRIKGRRTVYKVNHKRKLYIKSTAIVFGYALILVFLCIKVPRWVIRLIYYSRMCKI